MLRFLASRLLVLVPTFLGVTFIAFVLIRLIPGDPIMMMVGERGMSAERHAALMAQYGFDRPLLLQYFVFLGQVLQGNLGESITTRTPVLSEFLGLFPATIELSLAAMLLAIVIGLPAGVIAGWRRGSAMDFSTMMAAMSGQSLPSFLVAPIFILIFAKWLAATLVLFLA